MLLRYVCTCVYDSNINKSPGTKIQTRSWMKRWPWVENPPLYAEEVSHILRFFKLVKLTARGGRSVRIWNSHTLILRWLVTCRFFAFLDAEKLAAGPVAKAGPEKTSSEFLSIGSSKEQPQTSHCWQFQRRNQGAQSGFFSRFLFCTSRAPFELTRYTSRLICLTPSMEIGFKAIYWKWNKMGGRHLLIESIAPTLTFYTISCSDIVGPVWLCLVS